MTYKLRKLQLKLPHEVGWKVLPVNDQLTGTLFLCLLLRLQVGVLSRVLLLEDVGRELARCGGLSSESILSLTFRVVFALFFIVAIASFRHRIDLDLSSQSLMC